jgi:hypothetical protein
MKINFHDYFETTKKEVIFKGDKLIAHIPQRYQNHDLLTIHEDHVLSLGVFDITINDKFEHGLLLPSLLELAPNHVEQVSDADGKVYFNLTFHKNDVFIKHTTYMKMDNLVYIIFREFIQLGNMPKFLTYRHAAFLMAVISKLCGLDFKVNHAIVEIMLAHLFRDQADPNKPYRLTDYKKPPKFIPLMQITYGADNTTSKLLGSYFTDGMRSALVNQADVNYEFESILRA